MHRTKQMRSSFIAFVIVIFGLSCIPPAQAATPEVVATVGVGVAPLQAAVSPDGSQAWIVNSTSNSVSVIDTATNTVIGSPIAVGTEPLGIAIAPNGATAWVANHGADSVSVIDTNTRTVTHTLTGFSLPRQLVFSPNGSEVWVTNNGSSQVLVFNATTRAQTHAITTGAGPVPLAFSPDGSRVWVGNAVGNSVTAIDASTHTSLGSIALTGSAAGVAVSSDSSTVWVTTNVAATLTRIDAATRSIQGTVNVGSIPYGVVVSSASGLVWVANFDNQVVAVNPTTMTVVERVAVGTQPSLIAITPNQQFLYVPNQGSDNVSVVRVADASSSPTATFVEFTFWLPDGRECGAISPMRAEVGRMFTLPGVDADCRITPSARVQGWTIPVPVGFTGFGSTSSPFPPGLPVMVVDSQQFTVVPALPG